MAVEILAELLAYSLVSLDYYHYGCNSYGAVFEESLNLFFLEVKYV
jgi:hypothetical protein